VDDGARVAAAGARRIAAEGMSAPATDPFWDQVRTLFQAAAELPASERAAFLHHECADAAARAEVESLLAAHENAGTFLEKSIWDLIDLGDPERLTGTAIGPYRLMRPLGHGGMGTVFLAVREGGDFEQRVAIKLVRGGEALVRRFRQERQILAGLEHPNIARLLDGGTTADGLPYLVMEYVDGVPVTEYSRGRGTAETLRLFLQLCDAVQHAHRSLVIHRDIKPGNVLVTPGGAAKLLDFGIAKLTSAFRTDEPATRLMTPEYASPEQIEGKPVTTASDVYSLGVLLHELLTGMRPPFGGPLRGDLANIVTMATEPEPARRYGSVEKFADDIRRHLAGHPVGARRPTFTYRASKFIRRNALAVAAGAAIVIVTAIAFAVTLQQKRVAERRFDQVRSLARSVVFELHDAIATLPGSTAARALLAERALVYLDNLAADAEDNTPLQMELARAYLKIGDVQGLPYAANLGDTGGAIRSYGKALAVAEGVVQREPANADALALLADAHDRTGLVQTRALRWPLALHAHQAALEIRRRLPRSVKGDLLQARTLVAIGDCMHMGKRQIPDATPGHEWYERALQVLSHIPADGAYRADLLKETGRAHQRLGSIRSGPPYQDLPRALAHHDAARRALEECMRLSPGDATARRNFADQLVMTATAHNALRDSAAAIAAADRALPILTALADADADNREAQHDLAFAWEQKSLAFTYAKRWAEAHDATLRVLRIRERLIAADADNREDRRDMVRTLSTLAVIETARGNARQAAAYTERREALQQELRR
jgi:eukaryotic-like serine/threonine-protein kinase